MLSVSSLKIEIKGIKQNIKISDKNKSPSRNKRQQQIEKKCARVEFSNERSDEFKMQTIFRQWGPGIDSPTLSSPSATQTDKF